MKKRRNKRQILIITIIISIISTSLTLNDNCYENKFVYDYFRQEKDSAVYMISSLYLMNSDSLNFRGANKYCIKNVEYNGEIVKKNIFFKDRLLYSYEMKNGKINGLGYCFYPFLGKIAVQGNFCNSKLHGIVTVQNKDGKIIEIMKYRRGKYIKHIFHQNFGYKKHKFKSKNPLRYDYVITNY